MAALFSSILGILAMVAEYTEACRDMGIELLPPDINESDAVFSVSGSDLRYGLVAVKNIGRGFIGEVMAERERNGRFTDFEEFCRRMYGGDLNKRALESLIKCGCFDGMGANRRQLMLVCQTVVDSIAEQSRKNVDGQIDLFGLSGEIQENNINGIELPDVAEFSKSELMRMEREVTGIYLSGHPMDEFRGVAKNAGAIRISDILTDCAREEGNVRFKDKQKITMAGVIESVKTKMTRNNTMMAYLEVDDGSGSMELLAFQRVIDDSGGYMQADTPVIVEGRLSFRDDRAPQIVVDTLGLITEELVSVQRLEADIQASADEEPAVIQQHKNAIAEEQREEQNILQKDETVTSVGEETIKAEKTIEKVTANEKLNQTLFIKLPSEDSPVYKRLKLVHMMFPGRQSMVIYFDDTKKKLGARCIIHEAFVKELTEMLGSENVVLK